VRSSLGEGGECPDSDGPIRPSRDEHTLQPRTQVLPHGPIPHLQARAHTEPGVAARGHPACQTPAAEHSLGVCLVRLQVHPPSLRRPLPVEAPGVG